MAKRDTFGKEWIIENGVRIANQYEDGILTIRGLHYKLVGLDMPNTQRHYNRVKSYMADARREGLLDFDKFSDQDRRMERETHWQDSDYDWKVDYAKKQVGLWVNDYSLNRWENQEVIPELWVEKKTLLGILEKPCREKSIGLAAMKGYTSLTFLNDAAKRFQRMQHQGKTPLILYLGDYDPSGDDIQDRFKIIYVLISV